MNIWKVLLWTSPIWMVAECAVLSSFGSDTTYYEVSNPDAEFINHDDLCELSHTNCYGPHSKADSNAKVDKAPASSAHEGSEAKEDQVTRVEVEAKWTAPDGFEGKAYFDIDGRWLGGVASDSNLYQGEHPLSDYFLLDLQEWFEKNISSPIEEWELVEPRFFAYDKYIIQRNGFVGVLDGTGGWIVEPQQEATIKLNGQCTNAIRLETKGEIEIRDVKNAWSESFPSEALNNKSIVDCAFPFFLTEPEGSSKLDGSVEHYEIFYHTDKIYEADALLMSIEAIGDDKTIVRAYFEDSEGNDDGIIDENGNWLIGLEPRSIVIRDIDHYDTEEPFVEFYQTYGDEPKYYDFDLRPIDKPERDQKNEIKAKIKTPPAKVTPPEDYKVAKIGKFSHGLAPVVFSASSLASKLGYVNENGEIKIAPIFRPEIIGEFNELGIAEVLYCGVSLGCGRGFIDTSGEWVIRPDELQNFMIKDKYPLETAIYDMYYLGNNRFKVIVK